MARFKTYDYRQDLMVSLNLEAQLPPGSLEYALHHLMEERVPEAWFEDLYANDEIGRLAYSPKAALQGHPLGLRPRIDRLAPAGAGLPGEHHLPRPWPAIPSPITAPWRASLASSKGGSN